MIKNNIKKLRIECGLTQKELGKKVDLSESTISLYESGKREPDSATLLLFSKIFNTSVDNILGNTEQFSEILAANTDSFCSGLTPEQQAELEQFKQFIIERDRNKK